MEFPRPPTIKDVAALAGVSFSTAATALRGDGRIKPATRHKVQQAAVSLGYRSNRAAAILASQRPVSSRRTESIAYLSHLPPPYNQANGMVQRGRIAREAAETLGYAVESCDLHGVADPGREIQRLFARGIDGLLLGRFIHSPVSRSDLPIQAFSVVALERFEKQETIHCVRPDVGEGVRLCYQKLEAAGCRRIAASLPRHDTLILDDRDRLAAYLECWQTSHGYRKKPPMLLSTFSDPSPVESWFRTTRADGLITFSIAEFSMLAHQGWRCPEDFLCATLHLPWSQPFTDGEDQLAGVLEPIHELTRFAVEQLDAHLRLRKKGRPRLPVDSILRNTWRPGASLPE